MFWTEFGDNTQICRASMDGTSKRSIASTALVMANGITIDFTSKPRFVFDTVVFEDRFNLIDLSF